MFPMPAELGVQFAPGTMLGRYELLATIGTGGMASVILARQRGPAGFEKLVVIKIVHPHMAQDPAAVNMLLDEAKVAAQIDHPNVVHTYELGEAYGTFYIVMEYLAGESFAQVLKVSRTAQRQLTPFLAAKVVADAAEGLHFAHELRDFNGRHLGIVHRDVSPSNIVVQYNGSVKVVDFGIAKAEGRVTSTQEGELKGKYGYMPPEQIKNEDMDARSDVFSLGVVLWEALAQRRLFHADNVAATLMQVLTGDRVPPSSFFPQIPHALDIACLRALAPDPADRYQSAAEMKQAIDDAIWQARIGTKDIESLMSSLFSDRMAARGALMRRATVEMSAVGELGEGLSAFREPVSEHQRSHSGEIAVPDRGSTPYVPVAARATPLPAQLQAAPLHYDITPAPHMPSARPQLAELPYQVGPVMLQQQAPMSPTERSSKALAMMIAGVIIGVAAALFLTIKGDRVEPVKPAVATTENLVLDPNEMPAAPTRREPAVAPPVAAPEAPVQEKTVARPEVATEPPKPPEAPTPEPTAKPTHKTERITTKTTKRTKPVESTPDETEGTDPASLFQEAADAHMAGKLAEAEAGYKRAIKAGRYPAAYRGLGILYQSKGATKKAIEALKTYLKLVPNAKDGGSVRSRIDQLEGS